MEIKRAQKIEGTIDIPGDKSISHRGAILAAITSQTVRIDNFLFSQDCLHTLEVLKKLGVKINIENQSVIVHGKGLQGLSEPHDILYVGNSGTTIRLLSGLLAGVPFMSVLSGDHSINRRPMDRIIIPLKQMGTCIYGRADNHFAPLVIMGKDRLAGGHLNIPVASAQVKSCLLLAALSAEGYTRISQPAVSRDHTERMLEYFGADIQYDGQQSELNPRKKILGRDLFIPADISSAAYFIVACLILKDSHILLKNIGINETRSYILNILSSMGADIRVKNKRMVNNEPLADLEVFSSPLKAVEIPPGQIPNIIDEIPVLCAAAAKAEGKTIIKGAGELRHKESDRIAALYSQFLKLGINIAPQPDGLIIEGNPGLQPKSAQLSSFGDHRIAMAQSVLALLASGPVTINDADCVSTSFPNFFEILNKHTR